MSTAVKAPPTTIARDSREPVLVAMADTFIGGMGHPGSPIRLARPKEATLARLPPAPGRRQLRSAVLVFGRRFGRLLLTRRVLPFHPRYRHRRLALLA